MKKYNIPEGKWRKEELSRRRPMCKQFLGPQKGKTSQKIFRSYYLEKVIERTWPLVDLWAVPGQSEAPHPSPVLGIYVPPSVPMWECFQGCRLGRAMCCWDHLDGIRDRTPRIPYKPSGGWYRGLLVMQPPKRTLMSKSPRCINLPLPFWNAVPLQSLLALRMLGPVCKPMCICLGALDHQDFVICQFSSLSSAVVKGRKRQFMKAKLHV